MVDALFSALGGVGLFLFGMKVMTDALRMLAGPRLRGVLARFTTSPLAGAAAGAVVTAVVQSSSATVMTVIGFVGAGLMTFPQALGVVFGASIGTTMTGWMVALLGLRLNLGTLAMPLLAVAAVAAMLGRGRVAVFGSLGAGFALLFLGLDLMRTAVPLVEPVLAVALVPADGLAGRLVLVAAGAVVTVVLQSASVGVAMVLVLLASGAVGLVQAAALVIGMEIGASAKSLAATAGGGRDMRRTAWGHVGFTLVAALLALAMLGAVPALGRAVGDPATALVAFHTAFNVVAVAVMLPLVRPFARLIERLVPSDDGPLPEPLDRRLLADPAAAVDAARVAAGRIGAVLFADLAARLEGHEPARDTAATDRAVEDLEAFLAGIAPPPDGDALRNRLSALLHLTDHLHRLGHRIAQRERRRPIPSEPVLRRPARAFAALLRRAADSPADPAVAARLRRLNGVVAQRSARLRRSVLLREHAGLLNPRAVFEITDALRWLERSVAHAERIVHYGAVAAQEAPSRADAARDGGA